MRTYTLLKNALFAKVGEEFAPVALPHTWNAFDGQDGGDDYWRGIGNYEIALPAPTAGKRQYIELRGANHIATVFCNGKELGTHKGGFSTFRYELTDYMQPEGNLLQVRVDNSKGDIYPQHADFTFYGGLYRDVYFVEVADAHFDLMKHGSNGLFVSAYSGGTTRVDVFPVCAEGCTVQLELTDAEGNVVFADSTDAQDHTYFVTTLKNPHLWHGMEDPYLYKATATLLKDETVLDQVAATYGYRSFRMDPDRGFILNGKSVPLRGVCRHQDRQDKGWAISREDHLEDITMIKEIGANTIRLAHYQHDQYFYDLCDQMGFAIWAEIPYISHHLPGKEAYNNTISQMTELIAQCYNHPSIITWGISNEITIYNICEEQYRNLYDLHALCKRLDPSRPTTMAHLSRLSPTDPQIHITDIQSYNYYHGWYTGTTADNGPIMDAFHQMHPDRVLGVSEYGVENVIKWHSAAPFNHDYTEEYANFYHHELLKVFETRPWLWATHVWNMFDFAADARCEGGTKGTNNKGLVTYDRKTKKDAFYIYQAYWAKEPMVYVAGCRFADRAPGERNVTVYTNCPEVELLINGQAVATLKAVDHACIFENVPLADGANTVTARYGEISHSITLNGVKQHNSAYDLPDLASALQVGNWFAEQDDEKDFGENGYSTDIPCKELLANAHCYELVKGWTMSLTHVDISHRFKFVTMMYAWRDNENYNSKRLTDLGFFKSYVAEADLALLNKLLRGVKRN